MTAPAPDRAPDEAMRKAFEAWADLRGFALQGSPNQDLYVSDTTHYAWRAWQESARSQSAALADRDDKIMQLRLISNVNGDWSLKYSQAIDRAETAESSLADARAEIERLRKELQYIADANPSQWEPDVRDQFQQWAQNRARAAIAQAYALTDQPTPQPRERESTDRESR